MQIEETAVEDIALPPNVAPLEVEEAPVEAQPEPEVDWKAKFEEAEKARNGILRDLREERMANRERDQRLEELRQAIIERGQPAAAEEPAPPSKDDPVAYLDYRMGELQRRMDALGTMTVEQQQEARQRLQREHEMAQAQGVMSAINESTRKMAAEVPDYKDAVQYGMGLLREHFGTQGLDGDELNAAVMQSLYGVAIGALRRGEDPGKALYEEAKRFGYRPKEAAVEAPAAPVVEPRKAPQARSLSNVGGASAGKAKITREQFFNLPQKQQYEIALDEEKFEQLDRQGFIYV